MISMIEIIGNKYRLKSEVEDLGLVYFEDIGRVGVRAGSNNEIESIVSSSYHFIDELERREVINEDGKKSVKYYTFDSNGKEEEVSSYYRYDRVENQEKYVRMSGKPQLVDLFEFAPKATHIEYKILKTIASNEPTFDNINTIMNRTQEKLESLLERVSEFEGGTFNQKVNVHTGGGLLVTYNDLTLMENCCTDVLQGMLQKGWRIVSVNVQADQRRPDYVLGRYNPELDIKTMAKRG